MKKLGVMIVGPGWVAGQHILSFLGNDESEIRVIAGVLPEDEARARGYMEQYGFQCDFTDDYESALERDDVDVVAVCTINHLHFSQSLSAIEAGKHVLVEKPLCFDMKEARVLVDACLEQGVKTHVGHVVRFYPAITGLYNFVRRGGIGEIYYCESDYWHEIIGAWKVRNETGGSALLMGGCHAIDMVRWILGEENQISEVFAYSIPARRRLDFEYDPTISVTMKYENGAIGRVSTSLESNMPYVFHLQANGTKGTIRNNGISSEWFPGTNAFMEIPAVYPDDWDVSQHPFPQEIDYFVSCIKGDVESDLSIPKAAKTYEVIFAAELSAREGRPVKLPLSS